MKASRLIMAILLGSFMFLAGCGGNGKNGSLTVTATSSDFSTDVLVQATATYTHPTRTNLLGLKINVTFPDNITIEAETNNSGSVTVAHLVAKSTSGSFTAPVIANVDGLQAFQMITIGAIAPTKIVVVPPTDATTSGRRNTVTDPLFLPLNFATFTDIGGSGVVGTVLHVTVNFAGSGLSFDSTPGSRCLGQTAPCFFNLSTGAGGVAPGIVGQMVSVRFTNLSSTVSGTKTIGTVVWTVSGIATPGSGNSATGGGLTTLTNTFQ